MKRLPFALTLIFSLAAVLASPADEPKFKPLFNGRDLTGFKAGDSTALWRVEGGVLIGENDAAKKGSYLWTEKEYRDFVIEFDARSGNAHLLDGEWRPTPSRRNPAGNWRTRRSRGHFDQSRSLVFCLPAEAFGVTVLP